MGFQPILLFTYISTFHCDYYTPIHPLFSRPGIYTCVYKDYIVRISIAGSLCREWEIWTIWTWNYNILFSLEQVHWCDREHQQQPAVQNAIASLGRSSQFLPSHQSSQLVVELSEQVATLSSKLEQAWQTISQLQQQPEPDEETLWSKINVNIILTFVVMSPRALQTFIPRFDISEIIERKWVNRLMRLCSAVCIQILYVHHTISFVITTRDYCSWVNYIHSP